MKQEYILTAEESKAFRVKRGQELTIVDLEGGQIVDLFAVYEQDPKEVLSTRVTIDCNENIELKLGDTLYTNKYHHMFEILEDEAGFHDMLEPACSKEKYDFYYGNGADHDNCHDNINQSLSVFGVEKQNVVDSVHLFMKRQIKENGRLSFIESCAKPGDRFVVAVCMNVIVSISVCSFVEDIRGFGKTGPIKIMIE
ncbi:MAG TPA: urea carboxylase-associated family protein [Candidatus Merdenecus merdavium]|nr:urea carboxylase-associated family protein [Candidatus Merdenecus merdavium]